MLVIRLMALPGDRVGRAMAMATALAEASAAIARLDQALVSHPLRRAFLYRARLEAVRRQAAVDGPPALLKPKRAFDNHPLRRHRSARGKPDGRRYSA
jgi:hypothetical protein